MRLLHTADWHLGARLVERDRSDEHATFLDHLLLTLRSEKIDALLVSGDVFDAANPPQDAVALYFDFLRRLADLKTVKAVITGGNHDSASHLNAPRELLRRFEVHVFGHASIPHLLDLDQVVIAAVPYLRERDLRQAMAGESLTAAQDQVRAAIRAHYATQLVAGRALALNRPLMAMGHLTVAGATASESEREIHIGKLGAISADVFDGFDYTALGHLHRPQKVAGRGNVRYSGSPIPLSFSEADDNKSVVVIDTQGMHTEILPLPQSRQLLRVTVPHDKLSHELAKLPSGCWAEVTVQLETPHPTLDFEVREAAGGRFEVLKVLSALPASTHTPWQTTSPHLHDLQPREVFQELLKDKNIANDSLPEVFDELLAIHEQQSLR